MTYYEILEVSESASQEVITMAYRTLAVKYHPDRYKGDPEFAKAHWKRLNAAYLVLSVPEERKQYDEFLRLKRTQTQATQSEAIVKNSEPMEPVQTQEKPKKQKKPKREKPLPSIKRSAITVGILLPLVFVLELLFYSFIEDYPFGYAIFLACGDLFLFTFSYMLFPLLMGAIKKSFAVKFIENMSWINSAVVMVLWNVINESSPGEGWLLALIYTFVNKHVVIQMHQKIQQRKQRVIAASVTLLVLALVCVCIMFGFYVIQDTAEDLGYLQGDADTSNRSYDVIDIIISADSSGGAGDVFSEMNNSLDYRIKDNHVGVRYEVIYKEIGGVEEYVVPRRLSNGNYVVDDSCRVEYRPVNDCWYKVTLPNGQEGFVWGGTNAMYVTEIYN